MKAKPKTTKEIVCWAIAIFFCLFCSFSYAEEEAELSLMSRSYTAGQTGIEGTVTDSASLQPVSNALVELLDKKGNVLAPSTTNSAGYYFVSYKSRVPVSVTIRCAKTGYAQYSKSGRVKLNKLYTLNFSLDDINPPTGSVLINNNAEYTNSTSVTLYISAQDNESGLSNILVSNDNSNFTTYDYTPSISWTVSQRDGTKTVYIKFQDKKGLLSSVASDVIDLDTTPPAVKITRPANGALFNKSPIEVVWTADGKEYKDTNYSLKEEQNLIAKQATDDAGNTGSDSITVTLDTTPPAVKITRPANGALFNKSPIEVVWTADGKEYKDTNYSLKEEQKGTMTFTLEPIAI